MSTGKAVIGSGRGSALASRRAFATLVVGAAFDYTEIGDTDALLHTVDATYMAPNGIGLAAAYMGRWTKDFPAFRSPNAQRWCEQLAERNCITDVRGDVIRIGMGIYHDESDVDRFAGLAGALD